MKHFVQYCYHSQENTGKSPNKTKLRSVKFRFKDNSKIIVAFPNSNAWLTDVSP